MADHQEINNDSPKQDAVVVTLEDDKSGDENHFTGATLQLGVGEAEKLPSVTFSETHPSNMTPQIRPATEIGGLSRDRPGSMIGRQSITSTSSRTSVRPNVRQTDQQSDGFFSYRSGAFDNAIVSCRSFIKPEMDGDLCGAWLLTEIDHWDNERERVVLITDNSLFMVRFDFIRNKPLEFRRIFLFIIDAIEIGDFKYPKESLMPDRQHGGVRVRWNNGQDPGFAQLWNPLCGTIPWTTFAHHPLLYNPKENETATFNVDDFYETLLQQVNRAYNRKKPGERVTIKEEPIMIDSYASLSSMVFNQGFMGFFKERGGVSF